MTQYLGYDLGDGDTIVSQRREDKVADILMPGYPEGKEGLPIPSLLAFDSQGRTIIGRSAVDNIFQEIAVNFKHRPSSLSKSELAEYKKRVISFTDALFLDPIFFNRVFLKKNDGTYDSPVQLYVGHPTTWNAEDIKIYLDVLKSCVFIKELKRKYNIVVNIVLEMESRAAMLNVINRQSGNKLLAKVGNGSYVVIFDFGSSTTDVTIINRNDDFTISDDNLGDCNLGARLIDRSIYLQTFEQLDPAKKQLHTDALKQQCIYKCREAKELYFNTDPEKRQSTNWEGQVPALRSFPLAWYFNDEMVQRAANTPMQELGNLSYRQASEKLFRRVRETMKRLNRVPSLIILTGGASRMDFIYELCAQTFSSNATQIVHDSEPSACVSRGLVYTSIVEEKAKLFQEAINKYCDTLGDVITSCSGGLAEMFADSLTGDVLRIVNDDIHKWRSGGYYSLNRMESEIKSNIESYLNGNQCKSKLSEITKEWFIRTVAPKINEGILRICNTYNITYHNQLTNMVQVKTDEIGITVDGGGTGDAMQRQIIAAINELFIQFTPFLIAILLPVILTIVLPIVYSIVSSIVTILGAIIFSLLGLSGPPGFIVIAAIVGVGLAVLILKGWQAMKDSFMKNFKTYDIPQWVRNRVSTDRINSEISGMRSKVRNDIMSSVSNSETFRRVLKDNLAEQTSEIVQLITKQITLNLNH